MFPLFVAGCTAGDSVDNTPSPFFPDPTADGATPAEVSAPPPSSPGSATTGSATSAPPTEREAEPLADVPIPAVNLVEVARLDQPIAAAARPDHPQELWVAEREGLVRILDLATGAVSDPVLDVSATTTTDGERGLLGMAFDPAGDRLVVNYTGRDGETLVMAWGVDGSTVDQRFVSVLLEVDQPASNHNGGHVAFGPDGYLWVGLGDGGGGDDQFDQAQDPSTLLGAMLRIAGADGSPAPDNPCFATPDACRPEVFHIGLRNPWRYSFDPGTGDLWIADVGQGQWEEISVVRAADGYRPAGNFGWPLFEGSGAYLGDGTEPANYVAPVYQYSHSDGCSVTGGEVYRGAAMPGLDGVYLYGDFCTSRLWGLDQQADGSVTPVDFDLDVPGGQLASFATDAAGEVYVLSLDGGVFKIVPA